MTLYRCRNRVLCLDSSVELTRGAPLGWFAHLADFNPGRESYTAISDPARDGSALIGKVEFTLGDRSAHLVCLAPGDDLEPLDLSALVEGLGRQAVGWGALHLEADVDERSAALDGLRGCGFMVIAWQRYWKMLDRDGNKPLESNPWKPASPLDENAVRNLFNSLVPPLVQSVEPFSGFRSLSLIYRQNGEIRAFAEGVAGPKGMVLHPLVHPEVENVPDLLRSLLDRVPRRSGSPLYLLVRSYQAWIEGALEESGAQASNRRALMVKHFVAQQRAAVSTLQAVIEKYKAEPTAPFVRNSQIWKDYLVCHTSSEEASEKDRLVKPARCA